jgi:8-oxo-dGTP pyrophosphatase MutT (NUDIX family)
MGRKGVLQCGALPWRMEDGEPRVLLVTTRRTHRWIVPKGWPEPDRPLHEQAALEAWEEAGVRGDISTHPLGGFGYDKVRKNGKIRPLFVRLFALAVTEEVADWPEAHERQRRWFDRAEAADAVQEPELKALLAAFQP